MQASIQKTSEAQRDEEKVEQLRKEISDLMGDVKTESNPTGAVTR